MDIDLQSGGTFAAIAAACVAIWRSFRGESKQSKEDLDVRIEEVVRLTVGTQLAEMRSELKNLSVVVSVTMPAIVSNAVKQALESTMRTRKDG